MSFISKEVRSFVVIAGTLSIRAAAERLHVSPSALSRQLQILEEQLGHALFLRQPGGLALTAHGKYFFEQVSKIIEQETILLSTIDTLNQEPMPNSISVGIAECINTRSFSRALQNLGPSVRGFFINVKVSNTADLIDGLLNRDFDFIVSFNTPRDLRVNFYRQFKWETGLVCSPSHSFSNLDCISLSDVLNEPIALVDSSLASFDRLEQAISRRRKLANIVLRANSVTVIKRFVKLGECVTLLSRLDVVDELQDNSLKFVPLAGEWLGETVEIATYRGDKLKDPVLGAVNKFVEFLESYGPVRS